MEQARPVGIGGDVGGGAERGGGERLRLEVDLRSRRARTENAAIYGVAPEVDPADDGDAEDDLLGWTHDGRHDGLLVQRIHLEERADRNRTEIWNCCWRPLFRE